MNKMIPTIETCCDVQVLNEQGRWVTVMTGVKSAGYVVPVVGGRHNPNDARDAVYGAAYGAGFVPPVERQWTPQTSAFIREFLRRNRGNF